MNANSLSLILIGLILLTGYSLAEDPTSDNISSVSAETYPDSFFDVKIVDARMLDTIRSNMGQHGEVLKVDRGLVIGVIAGTSLYIRGDLNESDFPLEEIVTDNTKTDIAEHLVDIAFGRDNPKLSLFRSDLPYYVWFDRAYTPEDIDQTNQFLMTLNNLSSETEFEDEEVGLAFLTQNYDPVPYHYYTISIISNQMLDDLEDDMKKDQYHLLTGKSGMRAGMVTDDHLWLSEHLDQQERNYFILKGLLYSMGFHGESDMSDSFFNRSNKLETNLSEMDRQAIMLMYGGRLSGGMDLDAVEIALDLKAGSST